MTKTCIWCGTTQSDEWYECDECEGTLCEECLYLTDNCTCMMCVQLRCQDMLCYTCEHWDKENNTFLPSCIRLLSAPES